MKISTVFLYDESTIPEIKINDLADFIRDTFHVRIEIRKNIFNYFKNNIAQELASCRIFIPEYPLRGTILLLKR